jgi:hypothetical protein
MVIFAAVPVTNRSNVQLAKVAELMKSRNGEPPAVFAARQKILPHYFSTIKEKLLNLMNGHLIVHMLRQPSWPAELIFMCNGMMN